MKTLSLMVLLLVLISCGGGESSESSTTRTTYTSNPVSTGGEEGESNSIEAIRLDIEIRKLKGIWDRLNENETAVQWGTYDTDFRKAFKFGMLLQNERLRLPSRKADLILKAFIEASRQGMNPDFSILAKTTLKDN